MFQDEQSLFGDPVGGSGDDFDLSKLQALLRKNSMEIDNILRGTDVSEKLIDKSARSLSFSELTSPRGSNKLAEDLTVSYESKPSGGFSVFYTVPKQNTEKQKVEKIKDLIQKVNAETLLSENLLDSFDDYYEEGNIMKKTIMTTRMMSTITMMRTGITRIPFKASEHSRNLLPQMMITMILAHLLVTMTTLQITWTVKRTWITLMKRSMTTKMITTTTLKKIK